LQDKFILTREQNIYLAKKRLAISIYNSARMEGCKVTLHDVKVIMDGGSVCGISKDDEVTILNLRDAWRHILSRIGEPITLELINQVNGYVARDQSLEWGVLRKGEVGISGTVYKPKIPVENEVRKELNHVLEIASDTKRVIYLMLWMMRSQLYWDGNKRTAIICANHVMIRSGRGIISVPEAQLHEFNKRLTAFYETNDYSRIDRFVYDTSVEGQ
jgi:hypothetical protein